MTREAPVRVPDDLDGERLDRAVAQLGGMSRAASRRMVEGGDVQVNGETVTSPATRVAGADTVLFVRPPDAVPLAPQPVDFGVLWEDDDLAVIDKPAGVVTHPGAGNPSGSLAAGILHRWPEVEGVGDPGRWGLVHRLDKGTSGLLVVAKSQVAHGRLAEMIRARTIDRNYVALVQEPFAIETGTVDAPIDRDPARPVRRRVSPVGRPARTHFEQEAVWPSHALLSVRLETGRTHQIRVHLSAIGHPVVGDRVYGAAPGDAADPGRPWLHSWKLAFEHPMTGKPIVSEAPLPDDLVDSLIMLGEPAAGVLPMDLAKRDRKAMLLDATSKVQRSFEDILYEGDPWGIAGGPRDEYNGLASRLISELAGSPTGDEAHRIRELIPEADDTLISSLANEWASHPLLHSINRKLMADG